MRLDTVNPKLRAKLIEVASTGGIMTYGDLMQSCDIEDRFQLSHELGVIADDCADRSEPLLVAVGVLKETGTPSGGFYEKAEEHAGYNGSKDDGLREAWWVKYLQNDVYPYWKQRGG